MSLDPRCHQAHIKILAGSCPWCRQLIVNGQPLEPSDPIAAGSYDELKQFLHQKLFEKLDVSKLQNLESDMLRRELRLVVERLCDTANPLLNRLDRERLVDEFLDDLFKH